MPHRPLPPVLKPHVEVILDSLTMKAGTELLDWVTDFLASVLGVTYSFVGELNGDDWHRVHTRSFHQDGQRGASFSYELVGTPCHEVLNVAPTIVEREVTKLYPEDELASEMKLSSYCGVPLRWHDRVIGILVVCCPRTLTDPAGTLAAMQWLAARVGQALYRLRYQEQSDAILTVVRDSSGHDEQFWAKRAATLLGVRVAVTMVIRDGRRVVAAVLIDGVSGVATIEVERQLSLMTRGEQEHFPDGLEIQFEGLRCRSGISSPFRDTTGEIGGWLFLLHDLPLRPNPRSLELAEFFADRLGATRALQQQFRAEADEQRRQAEGQRMEALGLMAGSIAHDVNNLLVAILGNASLAREVLTSVSPAYEYLGDIELAAQRSADLAKQLLAYSGKGRFVVQPVNCSHVVRSMTDLLRVALPKNVSLRLRLENHLLAVNADITQLRQVVMNLVVNGAEAIGEEDGEVSVFSGQMDVDTDYLASIDAPELRPGTYVFIEVSDTGDGMTHDVQSRIFEPFYTTKVSGRGLGLAAVTGIVRGHGGALRVYSELGKGTTFKLLLPASAADVVGVLAKVEPARLRTGQGTILVVDDEPTVRKMACRALGYFGFQTLEADSGEAALTLFANQVEPIRLVLLDMTMPGINGEETFRKLRVLDADVTVVLMSGYNEQEATSRFVGKGLAGFMQKPFGIDLLRDTVFDALDGATL